MKSGSDEVCLVEGDCGFPSGRAGGVMRILRDVYYESLAWWVVKRRGRRARERSEDRRILEQVIIPFVLSRFAPGTVLDIGREPYEAFYNGFFVGRELWTIDSNPQHAAFGSRNHIVDDVANLRDHFAERSFDLVLMNGVFGWGLNQAPAIEQAIAAIHAVLRPGGLFVLGWNNLPGLVPVPLDQVRALRAFSPYLLEPLNGTSFTCAPYEHTFNIYTRS
jgi:SAM-dependent methyltransferase